MHKIGRIHALVHAAFVSGDATLDGEVLRRRLEHELEEILRDEIEKLGVDLVVDRLRAELLRRRAVVRTALVSLLLVLVLALRLSPRRRTVHRVHRLVLRRVRVRCHYRRQLVLIWRLVVVILFVLITAWWFVFVATVVSVVLFGFFDAVLCLFFVLLFFFIAWWVVVTLLVFSTAFTLVFAYAFVQRFFFVSWWFVSAASIIFLFSYF